MPEIGQQHLPGSQDSPILGFLLLAAAIWASKTWWQDYSQGLCGKPAPGALPGATQFTVKALWIASVGAVLLVIAETLLEKTTGQDTSQSLLPAWFIAPMVAAAVLEEIIFRGYLPIQGKGKATLYGSCVTLSILFALAHPYLWQWESGILQFHFHSGKAFLTTGFLFIKSLWFYAARFAPFNPKRSLLPCVAAHLAANLTVFITKAVQGYIAW
jgi:membrane protease YdiL (CAAX protease family)